MGQKIHQIPEQFFCVYVCVWGLREVSEPVPLNNMLLEDYMLCAT